LHAPKINEGRNDDVHQDSQRYKKHLISVK
jgi:hypothetical protein